MHGKFVTGALIGAALGVILVPELDRTTKRRIRKTTSFVRNAAGDVYDNVIKGWSR
jgi:gas vesicle protein